MAQSKYKPRNHPVTNNMPVGNQTGKLIGKVSIHVKDIEPDPDEEVEVVLIDGNANVDDTTVWDGNGII